MGRHGRSLPVIHESGFTINGCRFNVDSKYQPIGAIGQGSYGVVCSVRNTQTHEKLAIKKITPMADDEWDATHTLREIRIMRWLGVHENIISLKDLSICKEKDELYMVMELADTDLHRLIQSSCLLTEVHIQVIMYQVLSGIKAMHDNGILHRDLKPGNLLLNKDCELKITDFGLARMMPKKSQSGLEQNSDHGLSMMTEYVVTRWYRPPELMLAPNGSYDGAVDMWSVGCILGELILRKPLFPGTDFMDQLKRVFQVLPIPDPKDRGYIIEKGALNFLSSLPPPAPGALEDKLGEKAGPQALNLLRRLLCFNPKKRISAHDALAHPFFKGMRDAWGEIAPLHLPHSLESAFETQSLPLATLKQCISDEVLAFVDRSTKFQPGPQESESQVTGTEKAGVPKGPAADSNGPPSVSKNDYSPGSGLTPKGYSFNVPAKYKPLRVLSGGSDGIACASTDAETNQNVAIKEITTTTRDEWNAKPTLRDIRLMQYFDTHPHIASLQHWTTRMEKNELYLMLDLADTDFHCLLGSKTTLEETPIVAILSHLLCGAHTLHAKNGVSLRTLNARRLLVSTNGSVQLPAFGRARDLPASPDDQHQDQRQLLSPEYDVPPWYRPSEVLLIPPTSTYTDAMAMMWGIVRDLLGRRRPLFPGTDGLHQLVRFFRLLSVLLLRAPLSDDVKSDVRVCLDHVSCACSPSAYDKLLHPTARLASSLLCVHPARRRLAPQTLTQPNAKPGPTQLGLPPVLGVPNVSTVAFDDRDDRKTLLHSNVDLIQNDGSESPTGDALRGPEPTTP